MEPKSLLIVNYGFPPNPGIGGRRWALFAKELSKEGYEIHVLSKKHTGLDISLYSNILSDENIILHHLPTFYPNILNTTPQTLKDKIRYRFWNTFMKYYSKGSQYDKALFFERKIKKVALKIIEENKIRNVIVSGAPFRLCFYLAKIKDKIPNLIIDFRDPWTWGNGYGYKSLSKKKLDFEKKMEEFVIEKADIIFCPVEVMKKELDILHPKYKNKIKILPHGFDKDDIKQHDGNRFKNKKVIKLVFIGTLYDGIELYLNKIADALSKEDAFYSLDIYSNSERYNEIFWLNDITKSKVNYHKPLLPSELYTKIGEYDFCLMLYPIQYKDFISTKFFEIIYSRTPIIYIGEKGLINDFIIKTKTGVYIQPEDILSDLLKKDSILSFSYFPNIDIESFSYDIITNKLRSLFK